MSAIELILQRGRAYATNGGRYCTLQVYSTDETDMQRLVNRFGGNYYEHEEGWQWVLSKREGLRKVRIAVEDRASNYTRVRLRPLYAQFPLPQEAAYAMAS